MTTLRTICALVLLALAVQAREPAGMFTEIRGSEQPLDLMQLSIAVDIRGTLAHTRLQMTWYNPAPRVSEGRLLAYLPPNSAVTGYSLLVGTQYIPAVSLPRQRAREVYDTVVRPRPPVPKDPGLVEWLGYERFSTTVYPFMPHSTRGMTLEYHGDLAIEGDQQVWRIPLGFTGDCRSFRLEVTVSDVPDAPRLSRLELDVPHRVRTFTERYGISARGEHVPIPDELQISTGLPAMPHVASEWKGNRRYVQITDVPPVVAPRKLRPVENLLVFWDVSASRGGPARQYDIDLLCQFIGAQLGPVRVTLVPFHAVAESACSMLLVPGDTHLLRKRLEALRYDGATAVGSLQVPELNATPDHVIIFTDGRDTMGTGLPRLPSIPTTLPAHPQDVSAASPLANVLRARLLALKSADLPASTDELLSQPLRLIDIQPNMGHIDQITPELPLIVGSSVSISAKTRGIAGHLTLVYQAPDGTTFKRGAPVTMREGSLFAPPRTRNQQQVSYGVDTAWARRALVPLTVVPSQKTNALQVMAREWGLLTPVTSLLVLETLDDYVRHQVSPPPVFPMAEYTTRISDSNRDAAQATMRRDARRRGTWNSAFHRWQNEPQPANPVHEPQPVQSSRSSSAIDLRIPVPPLLENPPNPDQWSIAYWPINYGYLNMPISRNRGVGGFSSDDDEGDRSSIHPLSVLPVSANQARPAFMAQGSPPVAYSQHKAGYVEELDSVEPDKLDDMYLTLREVHGQAPAFYLKAADAYHAAKRPAIASRVLLNIIEIAPADVECLRTVIGRLLVWGESELAWSLQKPLSDLTGAARDLRQTALLASEHGHHELAARTMIQAINALDNEEAVPPFIVELNRIIDNAPMGSLPMLPMDDEWNKEVTFGLRITCSWTGELGRQMVVSPNKGRWGRRWGEPTVDSCFKYPAMGRYILELNQPWGSEGLLPPSVTTEIIRNDGKPDQTLERAVHTFWNWKQIEQPFELAPATP